MLTVTKTLEEALLQHFIYQKLDIAYAINKPFPFFEALRDNAFITERMYKESLEACQNLVPLSQVVHSVLTRLEKTFSLSLLKALFSQVNLREYPNLGAVFTGFQRVGATYGGWSRTTPILLYVPSDPAEGSSLQTRLPLPPPSYPPPVNRPVRQESVNRASSQQVLEIPHEQPHPSDPDMPCPGLTQDGRSTPVTSDNLTPQTKREEDSGEMPSPSPGTVQASPGNPRDTLTPTATEEEDSAHVTVHNHTVTRGDSPEPDDPEGPQAAPSPPANKKAKQRKRCIWSTPKRRLQKKRCPGGSASPAHGAQEKLKVADRGTPEEGAPREEDPSRPPKVVRSAQKTRTESARASRSQEISNENSEFNSGKRSQKTLSTPARTMHGKRKRCSWPSSDTKQETRLPTEKPDDDTEIFLSPVLPVTCGNAKGILYKEKMKEGSLGKCIQNEQGAWLSPKEFLMEGKRVKSKDWKKSVQCRGKTLRQLQKKGLLFCPPAVNLKK